MSFNLRLIYINFLINFHIFYDMHICSFLQNSRHGVKEHLQDYLRLNPFNLSDHLGITEVRTELINSSLYIFIY